MPLRPSKWFLYSPVAVLPLLAAWVLNTPAVQGDLAQRAGDALKAAGGDWAKLAIDGRDATLAGDAPAQEQIDAAVKAVAGTWGVRLVNAGARVVPAAPAPESPPAKSELAPPAITPLAGATPPLTVTGTWPEGDGAMLTAKLADKVWTLGKDAALTSDGAGNWTFKPDIDLAPGTYDLGIEVTAKDGSVVTDTTKDEILVLPAQMPPLVGPTPAPAPETPAPAKTEIAPPTIAPLAGATLPLTISGTWPEGDGATLTAGLAGKVWTLGKDAGLSSDGAGHWTFQPDIDLAPGVYDLAIQATTKDGTVYTDSTKNEIVVLPPALPSIAAPTVTSIETNTAQPKITGTWPSAVAKSLSVTVGGGTPYVYPGSAELTTDHDAWTLVPSTPLPDGTADVTVAVTDALGRVVAAAQPGKVTVDTVPPPAPTVQPIDATQVPLKVTGTFAEAETASLVAKLADKVWTFGKDAAFAAEGAGKWSFTPDLALKPGTWPLTVEATDKVGNVASATADIVVPEPAAPPPQMTAPTVAAVSSDAARPVVKGTWSEAAAKGLTVSLAGQTYGLGSDENLTSDGVGNWSLTPAKGLADGTYDVVAESTDAAGNKLTDASKDEVVVDAAGPATPQVRLYGGEQSPTAITGTWDKANAASLKIAIPAANVAATLGTDAALTADGDAWSLALATPLAPGSYDVVVETADAKGRIARDQTRFEILVKEPAAPPPPAALKAPTVVAYAGEASPAAVSGTWDEGAANQLSIAIPGAKIAETLGAGKALTSDGKGNWSLAIAGALAPGAYDVAVIETAADGRTAKDASTAEIYIKAPPPPPPPPPVDCEAALAPIANDNPILFGFNLSGVVPPYDAAVKTYATLLAGKDCNTTKLLVMGYTDYKGGALYNEALSLTRAQHVAEILAANGVDMSRIEVSGKGKNDPVDPAHEREARAKNRRVTITIVK